MRRLLLVATTRTYRAGAFLEAVRRLGAAVTVASEHPQALADRHPEGHLTLDFVDPPAAAAAIERFASRVPIHGVIAADDEGALIAALAAARLGLPHHPPAAVLAARDKLRARQTLERAAEPTPWFRGLSRRDDPRAAAAAAGYPCVLKPLHLSASRGVIRADDPRAFVAAFERILALLDGPGVPPRPSAAAAGLDAGEHDAELIVEGYLPGAEVAVEGLVRGGALRVLAVFDKPDPLEGPTFEETLYVRPSRLGTADLRAATACVEGAVRALGLAEGAIHAEVRVEGATATLVEIAPRSIGGLCSRALRFAGGGSLEELLVRHALGLDPGTLEAEREASGVCMVPIPRHGTLRRADDAAARRVPGIAEVRITIPVGQEVVPLPWGARYLGFVFARGDTPREVEAALRAAQAALEIEIEPDPATAAAGPEREAEDPW